MVSESPPVVYREGGTLPSGRVLYRTVVDTWDVSQGLPGPTVIECRRPPLRPRRPCGLSGLRLVPQGPDTETPFKRGVVPKSPELSPESRNGRKPKGT